MSLDRFEALVRDPAPGFRCFAAGDESERLAFMARVRHVVGKPGMSSAMGFVNEKIGSVSPTFSQFYELHDGVALYRDAMTLPFWRKLFKPADLLCDAEGMRFFRIDEWESQAKAMRDFWLDEDSDLNDMPEWFYRGIVFGEIPQSANYFVLETMGESAGAIYYCDHDYFSTEPFAESFDAFLGRIVDDPPKFLYETGCYARYNDGRTAKQWIPKEYVRGCSKK
jgi:hypothetical protein